MTKSITRESSVILFDDRGMDRPDKKAPNVKFKLSFNDDTPAYATLTIEATNPNPDTDARIMIHPLNKSEANALTGLFASAEGFLQEELRDDV